MPGQSVGDLLVNLGINVNGFTTGLGVAEASMVSAGTRMYFLGARIAAGFGVPLAIAAGAVSSFGMAFDAAMTESLAIMDDVSPKLRKEMESVAKSLAESSTFSSEQTAKAYYGLASAGYTAVESMKLLPVVTRFAQAGVMDLAKATDYLSTAQMAMGMYVKGDYQKNMEEMTRISDVLTEANNRSVGTVQQFAEALTNKAGQSLRFFGKSVEEGVAALAMLHQQGTIGKVAGQQLYMVIRDLGVYSLKFADIWKNNGITVYDAAGKMRNLADIMGDLQNRTDGMTDKGKRLLLMMLGIPQRSISATLALMNTADAMRAMQTTLENAGGATERVATKQLESFKNQLIMLGNQGVNLLIDLFGQFSDVINNVVLPGLKNLLAMGRGFVEWTGQLSQGWKTVIVSIGAFLVALGPAILLIGSFTLAIRGIAGIVALMTGTFGAVAVRLGMLSGLFGSVSTGALTGAAALSVYGTNVAAAGVASRAAGLTLAGFGSSALVVVATLGLLGYTLYNVFKQSGSLQSAIEKDTTAFNKQTKVLGEAIKQYDAYWARQFKIGEGPQQAKDMREYEAAIRTMADALGISEEQMRSELAVSNDMLDSLREQLKLRRALAQEARLKEVESAGTYEAEIADLRAKYRALYSGASVTTYEFSPDAEGGGQYLPNTRVPSTPERASLGAQYLTEIEALVKKRDAILNNPAWSRGADITLEGPAAKGKLPSLDEDPEVAAKKATVDAYTKSVKEMTGFLAGEGKKSLDILRDAWANLNGEQQTSPDILVRVWDAYKKIRSDLSPSEFPADIEFMTSALREQDEVMETWGKSAEQMTEGMDGLNPSTEKLRANFAHIIAKFDELGGALDPKWFAANKDGLDGLLIEYTTLPPKIQKILDKYIEWKRQARETERVAADMASHLAERFAKLDMEMGAKLLDAKTELLGFTQNTADKELIGMKTGLEKLRVEHSLTFVEMVKDLDKYSGKDKQVAIDSLLHWRKTASELENVKEKLELLRVASALGADKSILAWLSQQDVDRAKDFVVYLGKLNDRLIDIGRATASIRGVGEAFSAWGLTRVGAWLTQTADLMDRTAAAGAALGVGLQSGQIDKVIQGLAGIAAAFGEISTMATRSERAMAGAMAGASAGYAVAGTWGAVFGGVGGLLAGALMPDPKWTVIQDEVRKKYGLAIEQGVAEAILEVKANHRWMSDQMAMIFSLDTLIDQEGGVNDKTIDLWSKRLGEMFDIYKTYQADMQALIDKQKALNALSPGVDPEYGMAEKMEALGKAAADLRDTFDRVFPKIAEAVVKSGQIASAEFLNLIQLMRQTGLESEALQEFVKGQLDRFATAWEGMASPLVAWSNKLTDTKKELTDFQEELAKSGKYDPEKKTYGELGIEDQKTLEDILKRIEELYQKDTHAAAEASGEAERLGRLLVAGFEGAVRSGMDLFEAMDVVGPQLDTLIKLYKDLGLTSSNTAVGMLMHYRELMATNAELVSGVRGLNDATLALSMLGSLTADTLADLEAQGMHMYERMINAGFTEIETLSLMVPWLKTIKDAHEKLGIPLDENTRKLIEQAEKYDLFNDANTVLGVLKAGFESLVTAVEKLTDALLGVPSKVSTEVDVSYRYKDTGSSDVDVPTEPLPQAMGGAYRIARPTLFLAGEAGPEEAVFSGANRTLTERFGGPGAAPIYITVVSELEGRQVARTVAKYIPGALTLAGR